MIEKKNRIDALRMLISSRELSTQTEVLDALKAEGFDITQGTLSRDFKQLRISRATTQSGKKVLVLPNETMYKRVRKPVAPTDMLMSSGFISIHFSGNMAVIKTKPGYAASIAYNIDNTDIPDILGTIAGADTIFLVIKEGRTPQEIIYDLQGLLPNIKE